jgi:hypothetical protein
MTALYLLLTFLIEAPVHLLALRRHARLHVLLACLLMNGFTHPLASFASLELGWNYWLIEGLVMLVEGILIQLTWKPGTPQAMGLSLLANALSAGTGLIWMAMMVG